jgi:hypothetical protein
MAVKPHSSTQKWICRKALRVSVIGMVIVLQNGRMTCACLGEDVMRIARMCAPALVALAA